MKVAAACGTGAVATLVALGSTGLGSNAPVYGGGSDFSYDPVDNATRLPFTTPYTGNPAALHVYRASGLAFEVTYVNALTPVHLALAAPPATGAPLTGAAAAVTVTRLLPGVSPISALLHGLPSGIATWAKVAAANTAVPSLGPWSGTAVAVPVSLPGPPTRQALAPVARAYAVADVYVTAAALPTVHAVTVAGTTIAEVQSIRTDAANASETLSGTFSLSFGSYDPALTLPVRTSDARVAYPLYST